MKRLFATLILMIALGSIAMAQQLNLEPGLYSYDGEQYTAIPIERTRDRGMGINKFFFSNIHLRGATSDVQATGEFVMVVDPDRVSIRQGMRKAKVFARWLTPDCLRIVALEQHHNRRTLFAEVGVSVISLDLASAKTIPIAWEPIGDNAYRLVAELTPGEYAIQFAPGHNEPFSTRFVFPFSYYPQQIR